MPSSFFIRCCIFVPLPPQRQPRMDARESWPTFKGVCLLRLVRTRLNYSALTLSSSEVCSNGEGTGVLPSLPKRLPCQLSLKLTLFDVICKADKGATDQSLNAVKVLSFELRISAQYYAKSTQAPYNLCDIAFAAMTSTRVGQMHLT